jgi:hypothetical protein
MIEIGERDGERLSSAMSAADLGSEVVSDHRPVPHSCELVVRCLMAQRVLCLQELLLQPQQTLARSKARL